MKNEKIAIILLLLIIISMVGFASFQIIIWHGRLPINTFNETIMEQKVAIDRTSESAIYIRNTGSVSISSSSLAVYVSDVKQDCPSETIAPGSTYLCPTVNCTSGKLARAIAPGNWDEVTC